MLNNNDFPFLEFALRLRDARARKYSRAAQAAEIIHARLGLAICTYYKHEKGTRKPGLKTIKDYADIFGVDEKWLAYGGDEKHSKLNQLTRDSELPPFHADRVRYIPLLTDGNQINQRLADNGHRMKISQKLPIPLQIGAGERTFAWKIPSGDASMLCCVLGYAPGTFVIVDPDQDVHPNQFILVKKNTPDAPWIVRRYESTKSMLYAEKFSLTALNPRVKPEVVTREDQYVLGGVVIYVMHRP